MAGAESLIRTRILTDGPITVADYMGFCLFDPEFGYYMHSSPFGPSGDFVTAPEISQIFGELLGVWVTSQWHALGKPDHINLVELGPGRGFLMQDIMRVVKRQPGLKEATNLQLLEISPRLKMIQYLALSTFNPTWISGFSEIENGPILMIANEFFDALPIHQFQSSKNGWKERLIGILPENEFKFKFELSSRTENLSFPNAPSGSILETSPTSICYMKSIVDCLRCQSGSALIIDYGYIEKGFGDTLQAVKKHRFVPVLEHPGLADLTAHVNFGSLNNIVKNCDSLNTTMLTQRQFLYKHGIQIRAQRLISQAKPHEASAILAACNRLIGREQMGDLFKVMIISTL